MEVEDAFLKILIKGVLLAAVGRGGLLLNCFRVFVCGLGWLSCAWAYLRFQGFKVAYSPHRCFLSLQYQPINNSLGVLTVTEKLPRLLDIGYYCIHGCQRYHNAPVEFTGLMSIYTHMS